MSIKTFLFQTIIHESLVRLPEIEPDIWAKIYYMERSQVIAKLYLREKDIIIDNSTQEYDGFVYALTLYCGQYNLLPTGSEERGVLGVGSIPVAILPLINI